MRMDKKPYSRLSTLAQDIFAQRVVLSLDGKVWTDRPVDPALLQDVRTFWPDLVGMMEQGDLMLCPTHQAHKESWHFDTRAKKWICRLCKRLHPEVSQQHGTNRTRRRVTTSGDLQHPR